MRFIGLATDSELTKEEVVANEERNAQFRQLPAEFELLPLVEEPSDEILRCFLSYPSYLSYQNNFR